ncbi:MAG: H-NS histone family protein [Shimia sp.]|jgi:methionine salvage enolase-phosphatase E1|uniref:H-NS family nucleoid-associated regulatory protein n=1 Tax=Shimia sp. TaxID=1954381 RepID=UPI001B15A28B|nr:H-NS family nucleoid-associated regulatory protein [Shimia sp.]MBO6898128.1 H-NS histone family protein [Shimia sp.]
MSRLEELMQQQAALEEEIKQVAKAEKAEALKEVRRLCKLHGFTHNQLKAYLAAGRKPRAPK